MKQTISVFTMLKNSDLAAMSAFEAIRHYLGYSKLVSIRRMNSWELAFNESQEKALKTVETILNTSFYLMNPNKEKYAIGKLPEPKLKPNEKMVRLKVLEREPVRHDHLIKKIAQKTAVQLSDARSHTIWELIVSDTRGQEQIRAELEDMVVVSSSRTKGLLINPVSQHFEWI